jgi:glycosyltransferase involved in cell wall biosynthesis
MSGPKFSVLLPTRDRLELAKGAIETVRRQTYQNWELVVADNFSSDDVAGYLRSLNDPRIVYTRSEKPLPVTENWTRALDASSGDYVVMLGDDDALVPGYFERMLAAIATLAEPDFIYHGAYQYAFPGALTHYPNGAITDVTGFHSILWNLSQPTIMSPAAAHEAARAALDMRAKFGFNMQYFLFSRAFLQRLAKFGNFYQGPFPDFYAANMSMLLAERIGLVPEPLVVIGISPKSYGFHHFNKKEKGGVAFLNADRRDDDVAQSLRDRMLPGTNMLNSWLVSVALIPEKLAHRADLRLGIGRYRLLQVLHNMRAQAAGEPVEAGFTELWPLLNWHERGYALMLAVWFFPAKWMAGKWRSRWLNLPSRLLPQHPAIPSQQPPPVVGRCNTMVEVFDFLASRRDERRDSGQAVT